MSGLVWLCACAVHRSGPWGSTHIDQAFADMLNAIFSPEMMQNFVRLHPSDVSCGLSQ